MARVKRSYTSRKYRKKILKMASGYRGRANNCYTVAIEKVEKALQYAYRDRRNRKRQMRALWIGRINAAVRQFSIKYSTFIDGLNKLSINLNRKMLSEMAINDKPSFEALVSKVKSEANI